MQHCGLRQNHDLHAPNATMCAGAEVFSQRDRDMPATAQIVIRRSRPSDAAAVTRVMGDPDVFPSLMQLPLPIEEAWRKRLEEQVVLNGSEMHLVAELAGVVVGSAGLHPMPQLRRRHVAMLGISVLPQAQGQGVGRALMQALCDYADQWAQILRIELTVFVDNSRAISLYESCGFRHEGTFRGYALRQGRYVDVHAMARLHPDPPQLSWPSPTPKPPPSAP
jgi:L-phenylalanine/L-methionine N-acetyltransferase